MSLSLKINVIIRDIINIRVVYLAFIYEKKFYAECSNKTNKRDGRRYQFFFGRNNSFKSPEKDVMFHNIGDLEIYIYIVNIKYIFTIDDVS